ncbi:HTH-type transcriptional regulator VirS [Paraburkholderia caffeinitolerans]|uniref:HTH-type transcriptional regulator VirS n=1 Tax=Paraburkholderia caffeinitolerans TaxID=1723730 RepID=A0A6J5G7L6_9BURK|nr:AraC family transcriptional regulator [Paraburkholderia caffeinitolerans]CAB3793190.1 HTH-type transcriptional regulator VirS [Paraburkholderia caffeinitolerans]
MQRYMLTIRSASLTGYADLARHVGLDPARMLRRVGLNARDLVDPDTPISTDAVRELLENSAAAANVEDFGLQLAMRRRLSNLGPISAVMSEAPTGRDALESLCRYIRLINASLLTRIEDYGDAVLIRENILMSDKNSVRQSIEMAVGVLYRSMEELLGPNWRPRSVCFEHRPPDGATCHKTFFRSAVEFNSSVNGIVCHAKDLAAYRAGGDSQMALYARRFLDQALSGANESTTHTIRQVIVAMLPNGRCTADQVARHLGVDRRTLQRRLSAEETSFSALLQVIRCELASRQIRDSDRSLSELADLLGFSSSSAFAFWFRKHFGMTVSNWREAQ